MDEKSNSRELSPEKLAAMKARADEARANGTIKTLRDRAKVSPRAAIKLFCIQCLGGDDRAGATLRAEIAACTAPDCALCPHRPYQARTTEPAP